MLRVPQPVWDQQSVATDNGLVITAALPQGRDHLRASALDAKWYHHQAGYACVWVDETGRAILASYLGTFDIGHGTSLSVFIKANAPLDAAISLAQCVAAATKPITRTSACFALARTSSAPVAFAVSDATLKQYEGSK